MDKVSKLNFQTKLGVYINFSFAIIVPVVFLSILSQSSVLDIAVRTLTVVSVYFFCWILDSGNLLNHKKSDINQIIGITASIFFLVLCILTEEPFFGWLFLVAFFTMLILISRRLSDQPTWLKWAGRIILIFTAGIIPVLINQILLRFSEEEFYSAVFFLIISSFWFLLWCGYNTLISKIPRGNNLQQKPQIVISPKVSMLIIILTIFVLLFISVRAYQNSFFPNTVSDVPSYISKEQPILCEKLPNLDQTDPISGATVQARYAQLIANKEQLLTLDYGFLAIYYQTDTYFSLFKEHLLSDAEKGLYTTPTGSVKWDQWEAAQILYYYLQVIEINPTLFDNIETATLVNWINAINERAHQLGWVDWMYALAFSHKPVGAYLNQDIGAGLYSISNLSTSLEESLYNRNSNFLAQNVRGWIKGFRVTDDAISYQPVWITNSYFQSLLTGEVNKTNQKLSFDWIAAQILPNGDIQTNNFPEKLSFAPIALFGSYLLEDSSLLWLSNVSMETLGESANLPVQVGSEQKLSSELKAKTPDIGSCLIYGDSGLPEQNGPLAPDKIVFRNGWQEDDLYILLNLRFTGWHRYKASNSISLIYAGAPLAEEQHIQQPISWLPIGRALVRDKRIPIEQFNTFLIPRTGLDAVLNSLVSLFGPYSQDPPFYADVVNFYTSESYDYSVTKIDDWHGWTFNRSIHFFQDGPVFIIDQGVNKANKRAQINWHFNPNYHLDDTRLNIQDGNVDFLLIGQEQGKLTSIRKENELLIEYQSPNSGELQLLTIILPGSYMNAQFIDYSGNVISLEIEGEVVTFELKT